MDPKIDPNMDPAKRTKMMLEAFRRKVVAHEQVSRANQGRNQFSLKQKMTVTLPLVAIVFTLFAGSYSYTAYKNRIYKEQLKEKQAAEATRDENDDDVDTSNASRYNVSGKDNLSEDDMEWLNSVDKKW